MPFSSVSWLFIMITPATLTSMPSLLQSRGFGVSAWLPILSSSHAFTGLAVASAGA